MLDPEDMHNLLLEHIDRLDALEASANRKGNGLRVMVAGDDPVAKKVAIKLAGSRDCQFIFLTKEEMKAMRDPDRVFVLRLD